MVGPNILLIEPFYGGSHKVLIDLIRKGLAQIYNIDEEICIITMSAKKWHWRARTSALYVAEQIPQEHNFRVLFASSVLNLAELLGLRPDLYKTKKIIYFHENQLVYPVRQYKDRDFQYGYNQILTCFVADIILFNSEFNKTSFLDSMKKFFDVQPDYRPKKLKEKIEAKCNVMYFPVSIPTINLNEMPLRDYSGSLHIVWPHRWEHDKDPCGFLELICRLGEDPECDFQVSMVGEQFTVMAQELINFKQDEKLSKRIVNWGYLATDQYYKLLSQAHVVVSTAKHEFFGVAMLEATKLGCYPLCPSRLVYSEIYPKECIYLDKQHLMSRLKDFSKDMESLKTRVTNLKMDFTKFNHETLLPKYMELFR